MPRRAFGSGDGGFTLIEIMVALVVLALGAAAVVPVLIIGSQAANFAKFNTQAKNLAQQRMERMRDLQFHVERQNGPFVDLLDQYYTNLVTTASTRTLGGETAGGQWVSTGSASSGEPAAPFYRNTIPALAGFPLFSQVIDTQFLAVDGSVAPATQFPSYDSQAEAYDGPPTLLLGVTVLTKWTLGNKPRVYKTYTRIADSRGTTSLLLSRGSGEFMRVSSSSPSGAALTADVTSAVADGSLSTASAASGFTRAGLAQDGVNANTTAASGLSLAPIGTQTGTYSSGPVQAGTDTCGWARFTNSEVRSDTPGMAGIVGGVPKVPADVDSAGGKISAALDATGGGGACGMFSFSNQSTTYDPGLLLATATPLVRIPDVSGNAQTVVGSSWVTASALATSPHTVSSGAATSTTSSAPVQLFPGASFVTDGRGIADIAVTASSLRCTTSVGTSGVQTQTAVGTYTVTVDYWQANNSSGGGARITNIYTWPTAQEPSADPLAAATLAPTAIVVYQNGPVTLHLSDYLPSWSLLRSVSEGATNGNHALDGIFSATTAPVRGAADLTSSIAVRVGMLLCAADDAR